MIEMNTDLGLEDFVHINQLNVNERTVNGITILRLTEPSPKFWDHIDIVLSQNGSVIGGKRVHRELHQGKRYDIGIVENEQVIKYSSIDMEVDSYFGPQKENKYHDGALEVNMRGPIQDLDNLFGYSSRGIKLFYRDQNVHSPSYIIKEAGISPFEEGEDEEGENEVGEDLISHSNDRIYLIHSRLDRPMELNPNLTYNPIDGKYEYKFESNNSSDTVRFSKFVSVEEHLQMREIMATDLEWLNLPRLFPIVSYEKLAKPMDN